MNKDTKRIVIAQAIVAIVGVTIYLVLTFGGII